MAFKRLLIVILFGLIKLSAPSITGVTYMDHFDFEERYENSHECDPFHWFPLPLPQSCMEMYEKLIRENIASSTPLRVVKEQETYSLLVPSTLYSLEPSPSEPYEKMFHLLREDVRKDPSAPQITNFPGLGVVALYRQSVSKQSREYIKKIAGLYRDANTGYNHFFQDYAATENPEEVDSWNRNINQDYIQMDKRMREIKDILKTWNVKNHSQNKKNSK